MKSIIETRRQGFFDEIQENNTCYYSGKIDFETWQQKNKLLNDSIKILNSAMKGE